MLWSGATLPAAWPWPHRASARLSQIGDVAETGLGRSGPARTRCAPASALLPAGRSSKNFGNPALRSDYTSRNSLFLTAYIRTLTSSSPSLSSQRTFTIYLLSMAHSLSDDCTPLKREYDSCFNAWFEGYLEPAVAISDQQNPQKQQKIREEYSRKKADEFQQKCGKVWEAYRGCIQASSSLFSVILGINLARTECVERERAG